jgi:hypothetical protein
MGCRESRFQLGGVDAGEVDEFGARVGAGGEGDCRSWQTSGCGEHAEEFSVGFSVDRRGSQGHNEDALSGVENCGTRSARLYPDLKPGSRGTGGYEQVVQGVSLSGVSAEAGEKVFGDGFCGGGRDSCGSIGRQMWQRMAEYLFGYQRIRRHRAGVPRSG